MQTSECPRRLIDADTFQWLRFFKAYQDGHLWCAGGISDQPAVFMQAAQLFQDTVARIQ
jgi:hypothetical protein